MTKNGRKLLFLKKLEKNKRIVLFKVDNFYPETKLTKFIKFIEINKLKSLKIGIENALNFVISVSTRG